MVATGCATAVEMLTTVAGVTLDKESLELVEGAQEQLEATLIPVTAIERTVMRTSSDEEVVSVDANGLLTARKAGKADVTVTTKEGGYKATCSVTVLAKPQKVTGVIIDNEDVQLGVGLQEQLKAIVLPLGAANKAVSWSSSDETVVTVDANGLLTGRKAGKADVTVTTQEGGFTASIEVTVVVKVTGIRLEQTIPLLQIGKSHQFKAVVLPEDATDKRVVWQSTDEEIFTVDQAGNVHAVSKGGDLLIVKTVDGGFTDACVVDVADYLSVEVVGIYPAVATLTVGEKREFGISFRPSTAEWQLVEPSIQNDAIATVKQKDDHTVVVTGKAKGDTKLEVTVDARVKGYASIKVI
jgi:Ig domain protein group 2 domain protein